jgi:uncharacterized membrane protein YgcG
VASAIVLVVALLAMAGSGAVLAQGSSGFPQLNADQRVYDLTGSSLTPEQIEDIEAQIRDLDAVGADVIVMVRAQDATPSETLDQVEALQQAWVAETGANQDTAVAVLINRDPSDPNSARAGIYVGKTYNDGNVPEDEQVAIVNDELIPPLREGDVHDSFMGTLERLESSIVNGPPQGAFESWSSDAGESWVPWAGLGAAIAGIAGSFSLFRHRQTANVGKQMPTTTRPGDLTPALAGALANEGPQASAFPATLLDLATRRALTFEVENEGGTFSQPKIKVRLLDHTLVRDEVEETVWAALEKRAKVGVISSKDLARAAADMGPTREALKEQMRSADWLDEEATGRKAMLIGIFVVTFGLAVFTGIVAGSGGTWWPVIGTVALVAVGPAALVLYSKYSSLSRTGQEAAAPWKAYKDGLKAAAKDETIALDLNVVLADSVAMNLGSAMDDRLQEATKSGLTLSAFMPYGGSNAVGPTGSYFPWWIAFNSSVTTASGSSTSGSTVSGGGAGGGGGAAGST